jgi:hypothetical protein
MGIEPDQILPPFVLEETNRHGTTVYYYRRGRGRRVRMPPPNAENFLAEYHKANEAYGPLKRLAISRDAKHWYQQKNSARRTIETLLKSCSMRAKEKKLAFDMTQEALEEMAERQRFSCAVTGVPFTEDRQRAWRQNPYKLSIDRIDPKKGYVMSNVRLVCFAVNVALLDWGESVFATFAEAYVKRRNRRKTNAD